ncbi:hypothetical protein BSZ19_02495 [Bradyrhizobium japonicum]|uniref:Uncharacterized protein n=1 Tax=Bradyrhizobium japonicum TaxID=375 RepID=A0A1Y2K035_BRAJP|nr:hypothetical protein BSZ19_02495 [Bradyrhizobium japonicum]
MTGLVHKVLIVWFAVLILAKALRLLFTNVGISRPRKNFSSAGKRSGQPEEQAMEMDLAEQFFLGLAFKSAMRCFRSMAA